MEYKTKLEIVKRLMTLPHGFLTIADYYARMDEKIQNIFSTL